MVLMYHGTTSRRLPSILSEGLMGPAFLTHSRWLAVYYASLRARLDGGEPTVLLVRVGQEELTPDEFGVSVTAGDRCREWVVPGGLPADRIVGVEPVDPSEEERVWGSARRVTQPEEVFHDCP